jgi:phosphohistidine phosphatase SixA
LGILAAIVAFSTPSALPVTVQAAEQPAAETAELLNKLRSGGYIVYIRHTETDSATSDTDFSDMSDCSKQRVLSDKGREHATKLGNAVKALSIPVGTVVTSRFCRAKETAKLMGFGAATETADLDNDSGEPLVAKDESTRRAAALRKMLTVAPEAGKNTVLVGHVPNVREAVGLDYAKMKEGEIAIFQPKDGDPGYGEVGRVKPDQLLSAATTAAK